MANGDCLINGDSPISGGCLAKRDGFVPADVNWYGFVPVGVIWDGFVMVDATALLVDTAVPVTVTFLTDDDDSLFPGERDDRGGRGIREGKFTAIRVRLSTGSLVALITCAVTLPAASPPAIRMPVVCAVYFALSEPNGLKEVGARMSSLKPVSVFDL